MIPFGKCPKCEKTVSHVDIEAITAGDKLVGPMYNCVSFVCHSCKSVLSVEIDPVSMKNDIIDTILHSLGAKRKVKRR